jgi:diguanylate cyclase (GGDEF)-like protein
VPKPSHPRDKEEAAEPLQASEQRVLDLMDQIYELEQSRREQLVLRKFGSYLKSSLTRREAFEAVECFGPQLWPDGAGAVYFVHATEEILERVAAWGDASLSEPSIALSDCWATRRAQPHCVWGAGIELSCRHITGALPSLCIPFIAQGKIIGLLTLQRLAVRLKSSESRASAVDVAVMVAEQISFALANMSVREILREQSIRDPLTGLFNRRFFEEFLIREMARAERKTHPVSVIVLDIDHFKQVNDTFGHSGGDLVLRHIGPILLAHVRESDVACRIGGEEFLLLLSELTLPIAVQRAEDIRKALREMSLTFGDKTIGPITASFGAAAYPHHGRTLESLVRAADEALLDAKRAGRDRIMSARLPT